MIGDAATDLLLALCDRLDQARSAATPGPWTADGNFTGGWALARARIEDPDGTPVHTPSGWTCYDAALIVAAVNALPDLTAAVRRLLADRQADREKLQHVRELIAAEIGTPHECTPLIAPIEIDEALRERM